MYLQLQWQVLGERRPGGLLPGWGPCPLPVLAVQAEHGGHSRRQCRRHEQAWYWLVLSTDWVQHEVYIPISVGIALECLAFSDSTTNWQGQEIDVTSAPSVFDCVADCQVYQKCFLHLAIIRLHVRVLGIEFLIQTYPDCEFFVWRKDFSDCSIMKAYTHALSTNNHFTGEATCNVNFFKIQKAKSPYRASMPRPPQPTRLLLLRLQHWIQLSSGLGMVQQCCIPARLPGPLRQEPQLPLLDLPHDGGDRTVLWHLLAQGPHPVQRSKYCQAFLRAQDLPAPAIGHGRIIKLHSQWFHCNRET